MGVPCASESHLLQSSSSTRNARTTSWQGMRQHFSDPMSPASRPDFRSLNSWAAAAVHEYCVRTFHIYCSSIFKCAPWSRCWWPCRRSDQSIRAAQSRGYHWARSVRTPSACASSPLISRRSHPAFKLAAAQSSSTCTRVHTRCASTGILKRSLTSIWVNIVRVEGSWCWEATLNGEFGECGEQRVELADALLEALVRPKFLCLLLHVLERRASVLAQVHVQLVHLRGAVAHVQRAQHVQRSPDLRVQFAQRRLQQLLWRWTANVFACCLEKQFELFATTNKETFHIESNSVHMPMTVHVPVTDGLPAARLVLCGPTRRGLSRRSLS